MHTKETNSTNQTLNKSIPSIKKNYSELVPVFLKPTPKPFALSKKVNPLVRVKTKLKEPASLKANINRPALTKTDSLKPDWNRLRSKLKSMSRQKTSELFSQVLNDAWSFKTINYTNLQKGRSEADTKTVLNYMITALYNLKLEEQSSDEFDSLRFFDQVIYNPIEISPDGLFEKDIVLSKDQAYLLFSKYLKPSSDSLMGDGRKVVRNSVYRWPLPIFYHFDGSHNEQEKDMIKQALKRWEESTCLEFKQILSKNDQPHYLRFFKGSGCWSPVGYSMYSQSQDLSLGPGCFNLGTILHEIGHTLGFFHEQSRPVNFANYL